MMNVVWKYILAKGELQYISMPTGSKVLSVQTQDGVPCLWALGDPSKSHKPRMIRILGTGFQSADVHAHQYVGTFQQGLFVWHVFDLGDVA